MNAARVPRRRHAGWPAQVELDVGRVAVGAGAEYGDIAVQAELAFRAGQSCRVPTDIGRRVEDANGSRRRGAREVRRAAHLDAGPTRKKRCQGGAIPVCTMVNPAWPIVSSTCPFCGLEQVESVGGSVRYAICGCGRRGFAGSPPAQTVTNVAGELAQIGVPQ